LSEALQQRGIKTEYISEAKIADGDLRHYRVLIIVDTFSITAEAEKGIRYFTKHGGIVVGINEVGRFQGKWTKPWHYEDIFGVRALPIDEYGTALSESPEIFSMANLSEIGKINKLTSLLGDPINFGGGSEAAWITQPTTARVLAWFPSYVRNDEKNHSLIHNPVVAVSINDYGKGKGVWIAPNMHNRNPDLWTETGDTLDLLAKSMDLAQPDLIIPPLPLVSTLAINQIGFQPEARKRAIIRVPRQETKPFDSGTFAIYDAPSKKEVITGTLQAQGPDNPWKDYYYIADFSPLQEPGSYTLSITLKGKQGPLKLISGVFTVSSNIWLKEILPTQLSFLENYRCGLTCHTNDPIRGGYHDATGDYGVRMWSMPHVAYGLAECMLTLTNKNSPEMSRLSRELRWSVNWLDKMIGSDGQVFLSVKPEDEWSPLDKRPPVDPTSRILEKGRKLNYQTTYIVGMAHAAHALQGTNPKIAHRVLTDAKRAHDRIKNHNWKSETTAEVGNFLWGCLALYQADGDPRYLERAKRTAPIILSRQCIRSNLCEYGLRGDFFEKNKGKTFGDRQYKMFHAAGVYLGLSALLEALPPDDPLSIKTRKALDLYFNEHLLRGTALTPYGQKITALEPTDKGTFTVKFFSHPKSWVRLHGLNCDHLCMALVASKYADITGRPDLREFAQTQADWVAGFNPLGYCMIDFLGWQNSPMIEDSKGTGRFKGGIPNGIIGDALDRPIWGVTWDSREYWLPQNAYLIALIPHLESN